MTQTPERKEELQCVAINGVPYVLFRQYVELEDKFKELTEQNANLEKSLKTVLGTFKETAEKAVIQQDQNAELLVALKLCYKKLWILKQSNNGVALNEAFIGAEEVIAKHEGKI